MALEAEVGCPVCSCRVVAHFAAVLGVHTGERVLAVVATDAVGVARAIGAEARVVAIVARVIVPARDAEAILRVATARGRPPAARRVAVLAGRGEARVPGERARVEVLTVAVYARAGGARELGWGTSVARRALGGLMCARERETGMGKCGAGPGRGAVTAAAVV